MHKEWRIEHYIGYGYYITSTNSFLKDKYLHKNGSINNYCGASNFFTTYEEAEDFLEIHQGKSDFFLEKEFLI
jgi:hypothetical protein